VVSRGRGRPGCRGPCWSVRRCRHSASVSWQRPRSISHLEAEAVSARVGPCHRREGPDQAAR
jgi:hypothetical protein